jgi:hypothetical protein
LRLAFDEGDELVEGQCIQLDPVAALDIALDVDPAIEQEGDLLLGGTVDPEPCRHRLLIPVDGDRLAFEAGDIGEAQPEIVNVLDLVLDAVARTIAGQGLGDSETNSRTVATPAADRSDLAALLDPGAVPAVAGRHYRRWRGSL